MRAFEVKLPRQKAEISVHQKQRMGVSSVPKWEIAVSERSEKKEVEQQDKSRRWHSNFEQATGPPHRKKFKLDATCDSIAEKSSAKDPCAESIAVMDCKQAKTSSTQDSSYDNDYHEPTEKDIVFGKGRFIQNLAGNVRLRKLITSHFDQYESADSPQDKTLLAMRLVADIKESGGKFLKEDASAPGRYIEVSSIIAREKIAATFHSHRRRSKKHSKMEQVTTEDLKKQTFSTTSTEASLRSSSTTSQMGGKAMDRMLAFPAGPTTLMELGVGRPQGKLFGSPLVNTPSSLWLQHRLNLSPSRAFELSGELAMISRRTDITNNAIPFQGSIAHVYDRVPVVEKYATSAASREKTLRKQMGHPKIGSALSARSMLLEGITAPGRNKDENRVTLQSSSVPAGCNANAKNTQGRLQLAPSCESRIKNPPWSSSTSSPQLLSSRFIGSSSRRMSPTHAAHSDSRASSSFESSTKYTPHISAQEALQAQLYREMGLPGF